MIGAGIPYAIVTLAYDRKLFNGLPKLRFEIDGIPVYDPRADDTAGGAGAQRFDDPATWVRSDNPVVMIYNIMRGIAVGGATGGDIWGGTVAAVDLPYANWAAAMNACDAPVPLDAGGTEPSYRAGLEIKLSDEPATVIDELLKASSGDMADIGGTWKIRVGAPALPVLTITDDDIIVTRKQELNPFPGLGATFNGITASAPAPEALYNVVQAPPRYNAAWEAEDGNRRLVADLQLPAVPYPAQVQRLMQALIRDDRRFRRHNIVLPPVAMVLEPLDTIAWTSARNGYEAKLFEVGRITDGAMTLLQGLSLRERDGSDYNWQSSDALPTSVAGPGRAPPPTQAPGVALSAIVRSANQQQVGVLLIDVTWAPGLDVTAEAQYRLSGETAWRNIASGPSSRFEVPGIHNGSYDARARLIGSDGTAGAWAEVLGKAITLAGLRPPDVTGFDIAVIDGFAHLSWDPVQSEDLSHYQIRFASKMSGATYSGASTIVAHIARPATSVVVPARPGTYFIKAIDKFGGISANAAFIVTAITALASLNAVASVEEAPTFASALVTWDSYTGSMDSWSAAPMDANFGFVGPLSVSASGMRITDLTQPAAVTYDFASRVDLGAVFTSRVMAEVQFARFEAGTPSWDSYPGPIDTWPDIDTIGLAPGNTDDIDVRPEIATSQDMVTWSAWRPLTVGDFTARGYKFRARLITRTAGVSPLITTLGARVDMPDRRISGADIASGAGAKAVAFSPALLGLSSLIVTGQNMGAGEHLEITGKSPAGFTVTFRDGGGTAIDRIFDYTATGWGAAG